jgi:hypothetical protein
MVTAPVMRKAVSFQFESYIFKHMPLKAEGLEGVVHLLNIGDEYEESPKCHICLKEKILSREHIPPKSAFNSDKKVWDYLQKHPKGNVGTKQYQSGFWVKTVCSECNNRVCSKYAKSYVSFVKDMVNKPLLFADSPGQISISVNSDTLYIAKEIATMILALEPLSFGDKHQELRKFVQEEDYTFKPKFKVFAFIVPNRAEAGTIVKSHGRLDYYKKGFGSVAGEISMHPFGFIYAFSLENGYEPEKLADITHWFHESDSNFRKYQYLKTEVRISGIESPIVASGKKRVRPQII